MTRTISFRYYLTRNGADFGQLHAPKRSVPTIIMDDSGSIKTKFSGRFQSPGKSVDWLTDEIRPVMYLDGVRHNLGLFLPANVSEEETETGMYVTVDAFDRGWIVRDHRTEHALFFPAGMNYLTAVGSVLTECGIALISMVPTEETLAEDRADWEIGTSSLDIINQLLAEINYEELWFDENGMAMIEPKSTPTATNIDHVLDEKDVKSLMIPGISRTTDFHSAPNVFICVCSNADKTAPMVAVAENTNPQSPLSIQRRGRRISTLVSVDNIASQAELQLYADRMVTDSLLKGEVINVTTLQLPGYGVGDIVALRYGEISSICKETRWSMELKVGGRMQHELQRVVMNLD